MVIVGKYEDFEEIFQFFFNFDKIVSGNPNIAERIQFLCILSNKICFNNKKFAGES
jgi:hypothetical protein